MNSTLKASEVTVGFHPSGYCIDKTTAPMNRYTKWKIVSEKDWCDPEAWCNPEPVCFDSLPQNGWITKDKFDWKQAATASE